MKKLLIALLALGLLGSTPRLLAADAKAELEELVKSVKTKLQAGKTSEKDLSEDLAKFDVLIAEHKDDKTDDSAQILLMKAMLYAQVLKDTPKAIDCLNEVKAKFPDTAPGKKVDEIIASMKQQEEANKISNSLSEGVQFPDFQKQDLDGKPLSISALKGKIVLVDFWATWCGPCVGEIPNVVKVYEKFHDQGFAIVGISLDQDKDKVTAFLKEKKMAWPQFFDGKGWGNELAAKYGVHSIPATYLLDKEGKILAKGLRGEALEAAVAKALSAK